MKILRLAVLYALLAALGLTVGGGPGSLQAQTEFQLALRKKYSFRSTLCTTCHTDIKDRTKRNEFGMSLAKELQGKDVTKRLKNVIDLEVDDPKRVKVKEEVTKEFLEALEKVEALKSPSGEKYGDLLKAGKMEGTKLKE